jgi:hypothetical protein
MEKKPWVPSNLCLAATDYAQQQEQEQEQEQELHPRRRLSPAIWPEDKGMLLQGSAKPKILGRVGAASVVSLADTGH